HLLRDRNNAAIRKMFSMAMWLLLIVAPLQAVVGDIHGLNTLKHQPAKVAALEGHWESKPGEALPLNLFGWPDMKEETTKYALAIPNLGSLILTHTWDGNIKGLKEFAPEDRPNATIIFWSFRVMVGLGLLMIALGLWSLWLRYRHRLYESKAFLRFALLMGPSGILAVLAGWITTEVGRQPWVVYGVMRTADAVSPHPASSLALTLGLFIIVYLLVFGLGFVYILRLIGIGPITNEGDLPVDGGPGRDQQPMRPMSVAEEPLPVDVDDSTIEKKE
ncbi:MAG: cytochrome ubiquinol oxidase subunit I, partial [Nitrosomonadales bacterium]|nr:cytochrome ubiquinol oxidase subunit I [Nitrosomonadales bacterium]